MTSPDQNSTMYLLTLLHFLDTTTSRGVLRDVLTPAPPNRCEKEAVLDPTYYILHVGGYSILRKCAEGEIFASPSCKCELASKPVDPRERSGEDDDFCRPKFRFVYDRTTLSVDKSIPSLSTNSIQYFEVPGSTGKTAAYFPGNGIITIWRMSSITLAPKFKFTVRFQLVENYPYKNEFYNILGDGPCDNLNPKYSIRLNPVLKQLYAVIQLESDKTLELILSNMTLTDWVEAELSSKDGEIKLEADDNETSMYISKGQRVKSSPCPMEIGKASKFAPGFIGYVDSVAFWNCFGR